MTRNIGSTFAAFVLGTLALGTTEVSAKGLKGQSSGFFGFHRIGVQRGGWGPDLGFAVHPVGLRVSRGCYTQRFVTDDGEFIVQRACY